MEDVVKFCGKFPESYIKVDVENNPNFIFENDPSFNSVLLYDFEGNSVVVNSFQECEHYVSGGWNFQPLQNKEEFLQDNLLNGVFFLLIFSIFFHKFKKKFKIWN